MPCPKNGVTPVTLRIILRKNVRVFYFSEENFSLIEIIRVTKNRITLFTKVSDFSAHVLFIDCKLSFLSSKLLHYLYIPILYDYYKNAIGKCAVPEKKDILVAYECCIYV